MLWLDVLTRYHNVAFQDGHFSSLIDIEAILSGSAFEADVYQRLVYMAGKGDVRARLFLVVHSLGCLKLGNLGHVIAREWGFIFSSFGWDHLVVVNGGLFSVKGLRLDAPQLRQNREEQDGGTHDVKVILGSNELFQKKAAG
jgi:hypothetical protein